jgi:hypothetical protein
MTIYHKQPIQWIIRNRIRRITKNLKLYFKDAVTFKSDIIFLSLSILVILIKPSNYTCLIAFFFFKAADITVSNGNVATKSMKNIPDYK